MCVYVCMCLYVCVCVCIGVYRCVYVCVRKLLTPTSTRCITTIDTIIHYYTPYTH
jgi:hypothetical protein